MMKSFSKNSNLCDHNSPTLQTDRQTTCDRNTALCTKVHRAVKTLPKETVFSQDWGKVLPERNQQESRAQGNHSEHWPTGTHRNTPSELPFSTQTCAISVPSDDAPLLFVPNLQTLLLQKLNITYQQSTAKGSHCNKHYRSVHEVCRPCSSGRLWHRLAWAPLPLWDDQTD